MSEEEGKKYDDGKPQYRLIPPEAEEAMAQVLTYGLNKYGKDAVDSWRRVPDAKNRYHDAARRHEHAIRTGETIDSESGLPHSWHWLTNVAFIVALEKQEQDELPF